jgi:hypothetical protein
MGVKDLNILIKRYPATNINKVSSIVIDGTNLLIIVLCGIFKSLRENFPLEIWNSVDLNIVQQYKYIVKNTIADVTKTVISAKSQYNASKVVIVMDPPNTVSYNINKNMKHLVLILSLELKTRF